MNYVEEDLLLLV